MHVLSETVVQVFGCSHSGVTPSLSSKPPPVPGTRTKRRPSLRRQQIRHQPYSEPVQNLWCWRCQQDMPMLDEDE